MANPKVIAVSAIPNMEAPVKDHLAVRVEIDFSEDTQQTFDFYKDQSAGLLDFIQSVYIDNFDNDAPLTLEFADRFRIIAPANTQRIYPIIQARTAKLECTASVPAIDTGLIVRMFFLNVAMPYTGWGP